MEEAGSIDSLKKECRIITRYLVGQPPSRGQEQRYVEGVAILPVDGATSEDMAVAEFAFSHPGSLPYLDAALGLIRPHSLLRSKLLLMVAVLEASPDCCHAFLPREVSASRFWVEMTQYGVSSAARALIGLVLYGFAARSR
jgi:hypothetical protein